MALKYADTPTFLGELKSGAYGGFYTPKKVIVTTSHKTYSSGFTMLRYLYKCGATVIGSTSAQSGNGFGNGSMFTLKNTGLKMTPEELWEIAERCNNMERLFNLREGLSREDLKKGDMLNHRYFDER